MAIPLYTGSVDVPATATFNVEGTATLNATGANTLNSNTTGSAVAFILNNNNGTPTSGDLLDVQLGGVNKLQVLNGGGVTSQGGGIFSGSIAAGSATGATLTAGDLGASRSTTTGAIKIGGSSGAVTVDYGVTTASVLTSSAPLTVTGTLTSSARIVAGGTLPSGTSSGDVVAARSASTGTYWFGNANPTIGALFFDGTNYQFFQSGGLTNTNKILGTGGFTPGNGAGAIGTANVYSGTGSPNASLSAPNGSIFLRYDGGANAHLYVNTSGASTSGTTWTAVTD